uniref:Uncharacterized protein n=1 Tax=Octopus bimaculoides TaxID=37653 RepID=A0A0L8FSF6_OCTBM
MSSDRHTHTSIYLWNEISSKFLIYIQLSLRITKTVRLQWIRTQNLLASSLVSYQLRRVVPNCQTYNFQVVECYLYESDGSKSFFSMSTIQ